MSSTLEQIAVCVERGKINLASPYPPDLKGKEGADELTKRALEEGVAPGDILNKALIPGMAAIGVKFRENKVFVPDVLMAAKAMSMSMKHLRPFFASGEVQRRGVFVIGTAQGDLHDIGKNLVAMIMEGGGWEVVDIGVDATTAKFVDAINKHPECVVGVSALLTTTMVNMGKTVEEIKAQFPKTRVLVGGAPVTKEFAEKIGADCYSADPQGALDFLNK